LQLSASKEYHSYLKSLDASLESLFKVAKEARSKRLDPHPEPEPYVAKDLAEMVEGLVGPKGVASRIRELISMRKDKYEMSFIVASDIIHARFGYIEAEAAAEQSVRTALAIMTGGITAAPIQGISSVRIKKNPDGTQYLAIYFAGPIRSAGGTEQALTLVVADYVRRILGLSPYKPTQSEIRRFLEELRLYEREVARFQYHVSDEDILYTIENLPIEVTGNETDPVEVSSYRNLPRIETNRVRAGGLRVVNDGVVGRAQKILKIIEENNIQGWDWLKRLGNVRQETNDGGAAYMEDVIGGRPVFSFPSRSGGFRLRYGRSRNTGLAAIGIHPATMAILQNFLASGTQIRIEGPGKGGVVVPVDTIEPPIVKLKDGSVLRVETYEEAISINRDVTKILFLGDLLIAFGEFLENNKPLVPSGYTEEWWALELKERIASLKCSVEAASKAVDMKLERLNTFIEKPLEAKPTALEAIKLSKIFNVPLHPRFTYFWREIDFDELLTLRQEVLDSEPIRRGDGALSISIKLSRKVKDILEKLWIPHRVCGSRIELDEDGVILQHLLRIDEPGLRLKDKRSVIESISSFSGVLMREKYPTFMGARMGRPEKAKARELSPPVHVLFPVGLPGGPQRNIVAAAKQGTVRVEIARRKCTKCGEITYRSFCPYCGVPTIEDPICPKCGRQSLGSICPVCKIQAVKYESRELDIARVYNEALSKLCTPSLDQVKGVRGLSSASKMPEPLEKGILRAKHGLSVFKDGTIRFDATNAPLTHFIPREINVSVETLRRIGYERDMYGNPLVDENQLCELKTQDVVLPEAAAQYMLKVCQFVDELLERFYGLPPYCKAKAIQDLVGQIILGFAPHTSAAVIGRVVGFSKANVCYAHPLWHNIKRRDCDGDEDAIMLALDVLLNFSREYLPAQIGGMMDAPLLIISIVDPFEVDEAQNMDVAAYYPLAFYEKTLERADPKVVAKLIDIIAHRLGTAAQLEGYSFTHVTSSINQGNLESSYMRLETMLDKLNSQLGLAEKIRAVDPKEVARRVLSSHLIQDIAGNLKAFTGQKLRCKNCNAKYRRVPLSGRCWRCGGELTMTVHRRGIEKYLDIADGIVKKYDLDLYYAQRLSLFREEIEYLFKPETNETPRARHRQVKLGEFM
jgi:DNA polymerase II large subunit